MGRRGPGLVGMAARTAVVAGTATAVSGRVQRRQQKKYAEQDAAVRAAGGRAGRSIGGAGPAEPDYMAELEQLAQLRDAGHPHAGGVRGEEEADPRSLRRTAPLAHIAVLAVAALARVSPRPAAAAGTTRTPSATEWADDVCSAITTWTESITSTRRVAQRRDAERGLAEGHRRRPRERDAGLRRRPARPRAARHRGRRGGSGRRSSELADGRRGGRRDDEERRRRRVRDSGRRRRRSTARRHGAARRSADQVSSAFAELEEPRRRRASSSRLHATPSSCDGARELVRYTTTLTGKVAIQTSGAEKDDAADRRASPCAARGR